MARQYDIKREKPRKIGLSRTSETFHVISWFSCQSLDLVIFLEAEGHFCPLVCVMALE